MSFPDPYRSNQDEPQDNPYGVPSYGTPPEPGYGQTPTDSGYTAPPPAPGYGAPYGAPYGTPAGYGTQPGAPGGYGQFQQPMYQPTAPPPTYLGWAIAATLLCCLPAGVVSIVFAASVSSKWAAGDYQGAYRASGNARTWLIVSIVLGVIFGGFVLVNGATSDLS